MSGQDPQHFRISTSQQFHILTFDGDKMGLDVGERKKGASAGGKGEKGKEGASALSYYSTNMY